VRIASAALEKGLDIRDTLFLASGEALTPAKRNLIELAGCQMLSRYHIAEVGPIGYGCRSMNKGNCIHLFSDSVAAINHRQVAPLSEVEVNSLQFTTLLPSAAKILINADMDDVGNIELASCDCVWCRIGFDRQISNIHSVGKLTGYGMSLVGTEIVQILEGKLPDRFGGSPADYQLLEEEGRRETQLVLRVSPRVQNCSKEEIREFFLKEIRDCYAGRLASRVWGHAEALRVTRAEPLVTPSGKVLPLQLLRSSSKDTHAT
jgi:phenylacetate-coenzyme A ligase PaaK-like adenylate-forming protein